MEGQTNSFTHIWKFSTSEHNIDIRNIEKNMPQLLKYAHIVWWTSSYVRGIKTEKCLDEFDCHCKERKQNIYCL